MSLQERQMYFDIKEGRWHMYRTESAVLGAEWVFLEVFSTSNCRHLWSSRSPGNLHKPAAF
jgi:hypothetical protein